MVVEGLVLRLSKWPGLGYMEKRKYVGILGSERRIYSEFKKNKSTL